MTARYFVGITNDLQRVVFRSNVIPTSGTFGGMFSAAIGPFRTKRAALFMACNPYCHSVSDAERLSKLTP